MSAPVLSSSLTANCRTAMESPYTSMATACGQPFTPTLSNLLIDTAKLLPSACSKACSDALSAFSTAANTTCGEEIVFQDLDLKAHSIISELALTSAIGCVKDTDGSYCLLGQAETLNAAKISSSTNLITILTNYAANNITFACSKCARDEVTAAQSLTVLDENWTYSIQSLVAGQAAVCAAEPPSKNSAIGYYASSFLAFLPFFMI